MPGKPWNKIAIVGVGLIGASIGMAVLKRRLAKEVIGVGRRPSSLTTARRMKAVTQTSTDLRKGVADAELVIVSTPVDNIVEHVRQVATIAKPGTLITDAGSTKADIVSLLQKAQQSDPEWGTGVRFVGSHPLAGNDKRGPRHGSADLFKGRVVIVTPTTSTEPRDAKTIERFWSSLGAKVRRMTAEEHDRIVSVISHLPHLVASAIAATTPDVYVTLTAGGWQDTTRIAAGDPELWRQIFLGNRQNLLASLDRFERTLTSFRQAIDAGDTKALERLLAEGKRIRDAVAN